MSRNLLLVLTVSILQVSAFAKPLECGNILGGGKVSWGCRQAGDDWAQILLNGVLAVDLSERDTQDESYQVLMMSPKDSAAYDETFRQIITYFHTKQVPVHFVLFNYNFNEEAARLAIAAAEEKGFNLIISVGSVATNFFYEYDKRLKGLKLPVVTACSKDPVLIGQVDADKGKSGTNIAYTSLNIEVGTQVSYIKEKFLSQLDRIAVIYDTNNESSIQTQVKPLQRYLKDNPVEFIPIAVDMPKGDGKIAKERLNSDLLLPMRRVVDDSKSIGDTVFLVTGSTELFERVDIINHAAGKIPVLSVTPSHVGAGSKSVFMAVGVSFKNNALIAADYAYKILTGQKKPSELPVGVVSTPDISINFSRAPKEGIKVPFYFFESADFIYNHQGVAVRCNGKNTPAKEDCE